MSRNAIIATSMALALSLGGEASAQMSCIPIERIDLGGVTLFSPAEQSIWTAPYEGRCIGIAELNDILQAITLGYVDAGYVTSRAYLPEQNLADGSLDVRVIEGELAEIRFNGKIAAHWQAGVFPGLVGTTVNLRDIEQGLEQIRAMPSYSAEMEIIAGATQGASILDVSATTPRPFGLQVSTNNQGAEATGEYILSLDATYDHLLGLNESWSLNLSKSAAPHPFALGYSGPGTHSGTIGVDVPKGDWSFSAEYSWSDYAQTTPGAISPIPIDGWTKTFNLEASRLLHRGQSSKTYVDFSLSLRENVNFIAGVKINSSSRMMSIGTIALRDERTVWGGSLNTGIGYKQGLDAFGAEVFANQPAGQPNAQFALVEFDLNYSHLWQLKRGLLRYSTTLEGQWSDDLLYGTQQFSLGGTSSVRGTKSGLIAGNSGILWRNDLSFDFANALPAVGAISLYAGIDVGRIVPQAEHSIAGGTLGGAVIGLRTSRGWADIDLSYQEIVSASDGIAMPAGVFLFSITRKF